WRIVTRSLRGKDATHPHFTSPLGVTNRRIDIWPRLHDCQSRKASGRSLAVFSQETIIRARSSRPQLEWMRFPAGVTEPWHADELCRGIQDFCRNTLGVHLKQSALRIPAAVHPSAADGAPGVHKFEIFFRKSEKYAHIGYSIELVVLCDEVI